MTDQTDNTDAPTDEPPAEYANADDVFVKRDEEDKVLPVDERVPGVGTVRVRPMVYGQSERYFGDAGNIAQVGPEVVAEVFRNHVIEPDLEAHAKENYARQARASARGESGPTAYLTGDVVREEMKAFVAASFLRAILRASGLPSVGVDVNQDGHARIDFDPEDDGKEVDNPKP
jgi:hypothetical protein